MKPMSSEDSSGPGGRDGIADGGTNDSTFNLTQMRSSLCHVGTIRKILTSPNVADRRSEGNAGLAPTGLTPGPIVAASARPRTSDEPHVQREWGVRLA
jgi:hypothetical protein